MSRTLALAAAVITAGALAIASAPWALAQPWLNFVFKPLATLAVIVYAVDRGRDDPSTRRWVLAGLGFSLFGDVALMWPDSGFLPGLVGFLLAHLAYLVAFTRHARLAARLVPFMVYAVVAGTVLAMLWPGLPAAWCWRWAERCSSRPTRCSRRTSSPARCRSRRCGSSPPTGLRSGASRAGWPRPPDRADVNLRAPGVPHVHAAPAADNRRRCPAAGSPTSTWTRSTRRSSCCATPS
jgi:hypothetical protein